ncbi:MAG TPA: UbiX family flavin prenyltransferase [Thermoanaerobaculia bacterium]|nr:UbiX family flavin prenyltransferase [Thermoanaerobaculia bacterium]
MTRQEIVVGVSGASGARLAQRFVELVLPAQRLALLHLVFSEAALEVARGELDAAITSGRDWVARLRLPPRAARKIVLYPNDAVGAPIASGSYPTSGMIVVPCSAGTLGAIANGISRDLLQRAADVTLKERRPLILVFRESPYSLVHIENMRRAAQAGAILAPPSPAFYVSEPSVARFLDAYCVRAARALGFELPGEDYRWQGRTKRPGKKAPGQGKASIPR